MLNFIVLGQIPGTSLQLGFVGYLAIFNLGLLAYYLKKFHPEQLRLLAKKLRIGNKLNALMQKLKPRLKKLSKRLIHFRDDVLAPKLKFLK